MQDHNQLAGRQRPEEAVRSSVLRLAGADFVTGQELAS